MGVYFPLHVQFNILFTKFTPKQNKQLTCASMNLQLKEKAKGLNPFLGLLLFLTVEWLKDSEVIPSPYMIRHLLTQSQLLIIAQWGSPAHINTAGKD